MGTTVSNRRPCGLIHSHRPGPPAGFFPLSNDQAEDAQHALLSVVRRAPDLFGHRQSRWTLATLMQSCPWLRVHTPSVWQVLDRLDIRYKRGRSYIHSPDPHYEAKVAHLEAAWATAQAQPQQIVFLYQDECHYYRQPTLASAYSLKGKDQPLAPRGYGGNPRCGLLGGLNALTGQTTDHLCPTPPHRHRSTRRLLSHPRPGLCPGPTDFHRPRQFAPPFPSQRTGPSTATTMALAAGRAR